MSVWFWIVLAALAVACVVGTVLYVAWSEITRID